MKISALSSGSSGNCFYIKNKDKAILIDAGISCRQVLEKLSSLGENSSKIKGIFITHEHADHVKGADVLARQLNIPIFATQGTIKNSFLCSDESLIQRIKNNDMIKLAGMEIEAFSKSHDSAEPISFRVRNGKVISIITDIGYACDNVQEAVSNADFLVMESNHDLNMLENGPYPRFLKERIVSKIGHISNFNSGLCVLEHARSKLKHVMLAHLSKTNNTPELAFETFSSLIKERYDLKPRVSISVREEVTPLRRV